MIICEVVLRIYANLFFVSSPGCKAGFLQALFTSLYTAITINTKRRTSVQSATHTLPSGKSTMINSRINFKMKFLTKRNCLFISFFAFYTNFPGGSLIIQKKTGKLFSFCRFRSRLCWSILFCFFSNDCWGFLWCFNFCFFNRSCRSISSSRGCRSIRRSRGIGSR